MVYKNQVNRSDRSLSYASGQTYKQTDRPKMHSFSSRAKVKRAEPKQDLSA